MKFNILITGIVIFAWIAGSAAGQERLPVREFTNPEELVVLEEGVPFEEALRVIEELSVEFRDKLIINRSGYTGSIGIPISRLHWRDALDRIAAYNNLAVREEERYFQIVSAPDEEPAPEPEPEVAARVNDDVINFNTREIEIKATFFEGSRQTIRELGIDWTSLGSLSGNNIRVDNVAAARVSDEALRVQLDWDDVASTGVDINALFNAFESSNLGEVISSPTIKVMEGEQGRVQVGQDFSIRQRDFAGNVIDQFFSTGTILEVTPMILYHNGTPFIYMTVRTERSTAAPGAISTVVNKQEATTEVLMLSGESTVIAGLYETEENRVRRGIPILKDLPAWFFGLRYLFGYNSTEYSVQELVVVLQANLVPTLEERLRTRMQMQSMPEAIEHMRRDFLQLEVEPTEGRAE